MDKPMDKVTVMEAVPSEEEAFFERLYMERRKMYSIALSYMRSDADALEVVQEASCRAWMRRKKLRNEAAFTSWLIRITINCCMDELRRRRHVFPAERLEEPAVKEMNSNERIDLERAMDRMKPKYRHTVILKYYQDMTTAQIAEVMNKPEGTIKTWLREGIKQLRKYL